MNDKVCQKVIFVIGFPHSGTTLLGMMLGSGSGVLFGGEMQECRFRSDETRPLYKRACRACGVNCPIWGSVETNKSVYDSLAKVSGRPTIVDTTKEPLSWVREQAEHLSNTQRFLILLQRDPRAVIASRAREFPNVALTKHIDAWVNYVRESEELFKEFQGKTVRIQYEDLVTKPEVTLRNICTETLLPFEKAMLSPWDGDHHPLRGNMGTQSISASNTSGFKLLQEIYDIDHPLTTAQRRTYYTTHPRAVVLDTRWQYELTSEMTAQIKEQTKEFFEVYTWPHY